MDWSLVKYGPIWWLVVATLAGIVVVARHRIVSLLLGIVICGWLTVAIAAGAVTQPVLAWRAFRAMLRHWWRWIRSE